MSLEHDITKQVSNPEISETFRYDLKVGWLTERFRGLGTNGKLLFVVVTPLFLVLITAVSAFIGLDHISDEVQSTDPNAVARVTAEVDFLRYVMIAAVGAGVAIMLTLIKVIHSDVVQSSHQMIDCLQRIAAGQHDIEVPHRDRGDEYGLLALEIEQVRLAAIDRAALTDERENRAAAELEEQTRLQLQREEARMEHDQAVRELADQFESTVGDVVSSVASASAQLQSTSKSMAASAEKAGRKSSDVSKAMDEAKTGATAAAAASDEFAMSIGEVSRQAASSAELARQANKTADEADATISALSASAEQVGQIVELIQTIAQRTNLLALNASIEAARGGEAGRGFAVVASEVKELAMQTSRATDQVADQIRAMQDSTGASVGALRTISNQIQELETTAISIASAVDQQSVAGQDLARSIDLAARGTEQVSVHIDEARDLSLSTGSAASQVLSSATSLENQASTLRHQVDGFLAKVRSS